MNKFGVCVYWFGCAYVFSYLFLINDWVQFYDSFSILCTFVPAILAFFTHNSGQIRDRFCNSLKVMWISAALTMIYGVILTLSNFTPEYGVLGVGISVALLPLFYALCISLLIAPIVIRATAEKIR